MLMYSCFVMLPAVRELGFQKVNMVNRDREGKG